MARASRSSTRPNPANSLVLMVSFIPLAIASERRKLTCASPGAGSGDAVDLGSLSGGRGEVVAPGGVRVGDAQPLAHQHRAGRELERARVAQPVGARRVAVELDGIALLRHDGDRVALVG